MININLEEELANIQLPQTKRELFILESEILYILGAYVIAKEKIENKSIDSEQLIKDFTIKFQFAKAFFLGFSGKQKTDIKEQGE
ncbi:hypothetical protein OQH61_03585 [Helicobacter sp. MIT 21-1697]|uniref:hypothetical protein n=1 Tax=Helicobacter sp. MIT 21-1697 TaxID=2993733 RepID=UPI00224A55F9|nr:hypothetical protein [Helicobacter sp. MIT 21-1697]MCX2716816.1 hypothetical protein [Helicobacter sp. MIT 21-1697]